MDDALSKIPPNKHKQSQALKHCSLWRRQSQFFGIGYSCCSLLSNPKWTEMNQATSQRPDHRPTGAATKVLPQQGVLRLGNENPRSQPAVCGNSRGFFRAKTCKMELWAFFAKCASRNPWALAARMLRWFWETLKLRMQLNCPKTTGRIACQAYACASWTPLNFTPLSALQAGTPHWIDNSF